MEFKGFWRMVRSVAILLSIVLGLSSQKLIAATEAFSDTKLDRAEIVELCIVRPPAIPSEHLSACDSLLAITELSNDARAFANMGRAEALRRLGELQASIDAASEAINLKRDFPQAFLVRAGAFMALEDWQSAISDVSTAIDLDRGNAGAYAFRAEIYIRRNQLTFALGDLEQAVELSPEVAQFRLTRATVSFSLGQADKALTDIREALKQEPELVGGYLLRTHIYMRQRVYNRAAADAAWALELAPNSREAADAASVAHTEAGQFGEALAAANKFVEIVPEEADALNARCWVKALQPDPKGALSDCDKAILADPKHFQALDSRAFVYWQLGRLQEARVDLAEAEKLDPDFWDWSKREGRFQVILARRYLKSLRLYSGPIDGDFDDLSATQEAVIEYQRKIGVFEDGKVSPSLILRLRREVEET